MCDEKDNLNDKLTEKHLDLEDKIELLEENLKIWTDAITELSEIEDAFKTSGKPEMQGKTILDVGTDSVKPLYLSLKYNPSKIIGINESCFCPFELELESRSKFLTDTSIRLYTCSLFDDVALNRIREKEGISGKFNFVLVSKTLHHLRTDECVEEHECQEDEECCKYGLNEEYVFEKLLSLGERVIIYEPIDTSDEDLDKTRGRGGNFTKNELIHVFNYLLENQKYKVKFIRPQTFDLNKTTLDRVEPILRQVDCICFYVEKLNGDKS
ncbi:MAG: hypothetical protein ABR962_05005 [Candidatus Bathyarchaeia archaeon]|jgi:hypothetical protein